MDLVRRISVLLLSLILSLVLFWGLVYPQSVIGVIGSLSEVSPLLRLVIAILVALLLMALAFFQVRPDPRAKINGLVMRASGAITEVNVESARERIVKAVQDVADVLETDVRVKAVKGRAELALDVTVLGYDIDLPQKQKEINRALNQVINKQLGLRMAGQPRVHIRYASPTPKTAVEPQLFSLASVSPPLLASPGLTPSPADARIPPVVSATPNVAVEKMAGESEKLIGFFKRVPSEPLVAEPLPESKAEVTSTLPDFLKTLDEPEAPTPLSDPEVPSIGALLASEKEDAEPESEKSSDDSDSASETTSGQQSGDDEAKSPQSPS